MRRLLDRFSRLTPVPLMVRAVVFAAAAIGLWIAIPDQFFMANLIVGIGVAALLPALAPATRAVGVTMALIIGLWLVSALGFTEEVTAASTFSTACALYVVHSAGALAAILPSDAIVDGAVVARWAARSALVIGGSAAVTAIIVLLAPGMTPTTSTLVLLAGLGAVALLVWLLSSGSMRMSRRM